MKKGAQKIIPLTVLVEHFAEWFTAHPFRPLGWMLVAVALMLFAACAAFL